MNNSIKQEGKIPPHNIDAEKSLLGAILIDQEVLIDVVEIVKATDFYDKRHSKIFAGMIRLYQNHEGVDLITVTDELKKNGHLDEIGGSTYLAELTNHVPTAAVRRRLIKASADINSLAFDENLTVPQLLGQSEAELFSVSDSSLKQDLTSISDILDTSFDRINDLYVNKGVLRGVKTGYRDLDNMTAGLQRSDLIILAARPAMGKTTLVTNLAYNVATIEKKAVLFFSLEMSKEQLIDRMLADAAGVDSWNIRTGNLSEEDFAKLAEASGEMAEMRTKARRAAHDGELGLIIIDYLQLMQGSGSAQANGNRVQEVSEISRGLKLLARELNVPVIALSQLSRSVESRSPQIPQLADLRESGSIEQDADIVMFIYREAYYNPETERENITDLILAKHRHGPTGTVELYFHPERLRFMSLDKKH